MWNAAGSRDTGGTSPSVYGRVAAVHLTHPGSTLARALRLRPSAADRDHILVAAFTSAERRRPASSSRDFRSSPGSESALCVYALRDVRRAFTAAIQNCFRGVGNTGPDHLVQPKPCFRTVSQRLLIKKNFYVVL